MISTRAAVLRDREAPFEIEEVLLREPGAGQVLVRVAAVGLCHTDFFPRRPEAPVALPLVVGHEGAGVVESTGPGCSGVEPGDRVLLSFDSCGSCRACHEAQPAYCDSFFPMNLSGQSNGGAGSMVDARGGAINNGWFGQSSLAELAVVSRRCVVKLPPDLPLELAGPLACAIQTGAGAVLADLSVSAGEGVLVVGAGAVGLAAVMAARVAGATPIVVAEPRSARRRLALELGATHAIDSGEGSLEEQLPGLVGPLDYAVDTSASPAAIASALECLTPRGTCVLLGIPKGDLEIGRRALSVGRTLRGVLEGSVVPQTFIPRLIELWRADRFPFDRLIRHYKLADVNEAEAAALDGTVVKPVLVP